MTTDKPDAASLTTQGKGMPENSAPPQTIIPTGGARGPHYSDILYFGSAPIIPPEVDGGAEGIIPPTSDSQAVAGKTYRDMVAVEQRRQTVQAEAMVNLAVGLTLTKTTGLSRFTISPKDLIDFSRDYVVHQEIGEGGSHTIIVTPKE